MEQVSRIWFTPRQKAELWERWKSGQCIAAIARTLGRKNKSGVYRILALNGGIIPTPRRRAPLGLARAGGGPVTPSDCLWPWPGPLDSEPGDQTQWRRPTLSGQPG